MASSPRPDSRFATPVRPGARTALVLALGLGACLSEEAGPAEPSVSPWVDHHVHLLSPELVADWSSLGVSFSRAAESYGDAAALLEDTPVERAVLVSMAYLYGSDWFREGLELGEADELQRVQRENDFVLAIARGRPSRLKGLAGVNPLRPYALDELSRCLDAGGAAGIKLHLASSGVDLRLDEHLWAVEEVAALAEARGVPLLLHLDTQMRGTDVEHVERFLELVLDPHPGLRLIVAHLGGSGGYGPWTQAVLSVFIDRIERDPGFAARPISFDLSAVLLAEESEGVPPTTDEEAARLGRDLERLGLERVVFGSDWPVFGSAETFALLAERTGVDLHLLTGIRERSAPGLWR